MRKKIFSLVAILTASCQAIAQEETKVSQADIMDIKDPIFLLDPMILLFIGIGVLVVGILFWIAVVVFKRMTQPPELAPPPPYEIALNHLRKARNWLQPETTERFCTEVSAITRGFLEAHFKLPASEQTTEEFFSNSSQTDIFSPEQRIELKDFSELCDLAKFANYGLGKDDMEKLYHTAEVFIETTGKPSGQPDLENPDAITPS
ncbi:MAG: hypothetical protein O3C43_16840 [Verrucomicrobia bacterium]|nr:hypothetical protein [Verrucomicrobiota bacterium]MDA1068156.1 hypothetical protein [Verrucomicrobiota bacterium]